MSRSHTRLLDSVWPTLLKYAFCAGVAVAAYVKTGRTGTLVVSLIEVLWVFLACNEVARRSRRAASVLSGVLALLLCVQLLVLTFSNSFVTLLLLSNADSIEDLAGKMGVYLAAVLAMLLFVALPVRHVELPAPRLLGGLGSAAGLMFLLAATDAVLVDTMGPATSPLFAYAELASERLRVEQDRQEVLELRDEPDLTSTFYHAGISSYRAKPSSLPQRPNVVLIFTEGLSQHVIDDERGIMPNVARYQAESLSFDSYYNHTFATYRGLIGQLFSGYQYENFDTNKLVPLPWLFEDQGYQTAFINVEPSNRDFYHYLNTLGFQQVVDYPDEEHEGMIPGCLSDREAYAKLLEQMDLMGSGGQPFFLGIYTVGTHASLDGVDHKFGDGQDSELNKFHDADWQFGAFMDAFRASRWYDNTVIVFTADHCTYGDMYFSDAFPEYRRTSAMVDAMPLFIYHKGVVPERIDVDGRNSLCLAPTVLDYLDISGENYFMGVSLFGSTARANEMETFFSDGGSGEFVTTKGRVRRPTDEEQERATTILKQYYAAKQQDPVAREQP